MGALNIIVGKLKAKAVLCLCLCSSNSYGGIELGEVAYSFSKSLTIPDESHSYLYLNALELVAPCVTAVKH